MSGTEDSSHQLRPFQFSLSRLAGLVAISAVACWIIREAVWIVLIAVWLVIVVTIPVALAGSLHISCLIWNKLWKTSAMQVVVGTLFLLVAVPFSPLLLLCIDWEGHLRRWRNSGHGQPWKTVPLHRIISRAPNSQKPTVF